MNTHLSYIIISRKETKGDGVNNYDAVENTHTYKKQAKQLLVILFLLPSLCGFLLFYLVPFIAGISYVLTRIK